MKTTWNGSSPTNCDICARSFVLAFYDARIPNCGWALLCSGCFGDFGCSLGVGRGQKYELDAPDGTVWTKVTIH